MKTERYNSLPLYLVAAVLMQACMKPAPGTNVEEVIDPCVATPSLCSTGQLPDNIYNLAPYSTVTSSSSFSNRYLPKQLKDEIATLSSEFTAWVPSSGSVNNAWVRFEWSTPVMVDVIGLYDLADDDNLVTKGEVRFISKDDSVYIPSVPFEMEESQTKGIKTSSGDMGEWVSGPGEEIIALEVRILDHQSVRNFLGFDLAGLNEVIIGGVRTKDTSKDVEVDVNIAAYAKVVSASSVKNTIDGKLAGEFSARNVNDENAAEWVSNGSGSNASIDLEFDLPYCVQKIVLKDRANSNHRFTHAKVVFNESKIITDSATGSKSSGTASLSITVPTDYREDVKKISVFLDQTIGMDTGLSEIEAYPCD